MSDHSGRARFAHVVLRVPDNASEGDVIEAIDCMIGHALDGHGMRCASAQEFGQMLLEDGGLEGLLEQVKANEERFSMKTEVMAVRSKSAMDADPFGLFGKKEDVILQ